MCGRAEAEAASFTQSSAHQDDTERGLSSTSGPERGKGAEEDDAEDGSQVISLLECRGGEAPDLRQAVFSLYQEDFTL